MSIIREIKAALRWVFNIKDEVKLAVKQYEKYHLIDDETKVVYVQSSSNSIVFYRNSGDLKIEGASITWFLDHYRKIS